MSNKECVAFSLLQGKINFLVKFIKLKTYRPSDYYKSPTHAQ